MKFSPIFIAILAVISPTVFAQVADTTPNQQLETIEVVAQQETESLSQNTSATKFSHDVLDVPFSRSLVDSQSLKQNDIQKVDDAIDFASGVFRQSNYGGGFWDNYSFRGFNTDPDMGAVTIRNGFGASRGINTPKEMVNVESLDFAKGGAGSIYGRGEVGGLLNVTTKKPKWHKESIINARVNTDEKYRLSLEHTAPINDQIAYRIAVAGEDNKSFRDYVYSKHLFISPQLTWNLSDRTSLEVDSEFLHRKGLFDRGLTAVNQQFVMDKSTFTGEPDDVNTLKSEFLQLRLNHQMPNDWKINSAINYKHSTLEGTSTEPRRMLADNTTLTRFRRHRDNESTDIMAQTDVLGTVQSNWAKHDILLSAEVGQLEYKQHLLRRNPDLRNGLYLNSIDIRKGQQVYHNNVYQLTSANENEHFNEQQRYLGLNVQDQMFFNDNFSLLAGLRFDYVKQHFENHNRRQYNGLQTSSKNHHQFSPRLGVNYKFNDDVSVYANYSKAFAMNSRLDAQGNTFEPEKGTNYEIGAKYKFNQRGLLGIALFNADKRNVLVYNANTDYNETAGKVSSRGLELDVNYNITDQWNISANYAYIDAQVEEDLRLPKGARLSNVAKHSGTFTTNYEFLQDGERKAGVGGSVIYMGDRSGNPEDDGFTLPSYTLVNTHGYYAPSERVRYQLNINNVLNKDYYIASYSDKWIQAGEPLNASLSMTWKF